jgi:signal transduction histidine kinase
MDLKKYKVKTKLYILVLVILIPITLVQSYFIYEQHTQYIELQLDANSDFAKAISMVVINHLNSIECDLFSIGMTIISFPHLNPQEVNSYLEMKNNYNPTLKNIGCLDPKGTVLYSSSEAVIGLDGRDREYYNRILAGEDFVVNEIIRTKSDHAPNIIVAKAIRSEGQLLGIMTGTLNTAMFEDIMPQHRIKPYTFFGVAEKNGIIVYRNGSPQIIDEMVSVNPTGPIQEALESGTTTKAKKAYSFYTDTSFLTVANPIPDINWVAYAISDYRVVLGNAYRNIQYHLLALFLTVVLSVYMSVQVSKSILEPIRSVQNFAQNALESNFNVRTNIYGNDELAATGAALNHMAFTIHQLENNRKLFIQSSAHELRNPMTGIKGIVYLMRNRIANGKPAEEILKMLAVIENEVDRLSVLLNQLLDAYNEQHASGRGLRYIWETLNLVEIVEKVIDNFQATTEGCEIYLKTYVKQAYVRGDGNRLEDVIRNLLSNSIKYSSNEKRTTVLIWVSEDSAMVAVKDRGIGIPENQLELIFNSFFRAENLQGKDPGGMGLGLYICKEIISNHGGRVWAENNIDKGSTFYVKLPLKREKDNGENNPNN